MLHVLAGAARAEGPAGEAVVVLDRGAAAKPRTSEDAALAARVARALGAEVPLLLQAARADGVPRSGEAKGATREELEKDARARTRGAFQGPTDVRFALATAQKRKGGALGLVVLVGPFGAAGGAPAEKALAAWNESAPDAVRLICLGASAEARAALAGAKGHVERGLVVLAYGDAVADALPYSPFDGGDAGPVPLEAVLRVPFEALAIGEGPGETTSPLEMTSAAAGDRVASAVAEGPDGSSVELRLRRESGERVATVSFRVPARPDLVALADPPSPRTFTWDRLAVDSRWTASPANAPVTKGTIGSSYAWRHTFRRTRVGPPPTWEVRREDGGPLEEGLTVDVAPEVFVSDTVAESQVTVRLAPTRRTPRTAEGQVLLTAGNAGFEGRIPYRWELLAGRVGLRLEGAGAVTAVPAAIADVPGRLTLTAENPNAPLEAPVLWTIEPAALSSRVRVRYVETDGATEERAPGKPALLRVGVPHDVRIDLVPADRGEGFDGATAVLAVGETPGLDPVPPVRVSLRSRHPSLLASPGASYRYEDGRWTARAPLTLRVEPDGGDGPWLDALRSVTPRIESPPGSVTAWTLDPAGSGAWAVSPSGTWNGPRGDAFAERRHPARLQIDWPAGRAPGEMQVEVVQAPRWGAAGYVLIALAALAVLLVTFAARQMRVPPLAGTLLYAAEGLEGAVGRIDLASAGRRARAIRSDPEGRLTFEAARPDATGRPAVALVRPTRVGGILEVPDEEGRIERRLLVDGLTVTVGRHRLRYMSGSDDARAPLSSEEVPDLLGPEYDLRSDRRAALSAGGLPSDAADDANVAADAPGERS